MLRGKAKKKKNYFLSDFKTTVILPLHQQAPLKDEGIFFFFFFCGQKRCLE